MQLGLKLKSNISRPVAKSTSLKKSKSKKKEADHQHKTSKKMDQH